MKKFTDKPYGFTLIEMVVVVLILSALAATAYARMSQIDSRARLASLQSFRATVLSVATLAKGTCLADAPCNSNTGTPSTSIEGHTIYFSHGYPVGTAGQADGAGSLTQLVDVGRFTLQTAQSDSNHARYVLPGARDPNHCKLDYTISVNADNSGSLNVSIDGSGC